MQRSHRERHLRLWFLLTPLVALAIYLALTSRSTYPEQPLPATAQP